MELTEAVVLSLINTAIIVAVYVLRTQYRRRVKIYGPFAYKLNESGILKEIAAGSIPSGVVNGLRERILEKFERPEAIMPVKVFAPVVFLMQLIVLLTMFK